MTHNHLAQCWPCTLSVSPSLVASLPRARSHFSPAFRHLNIDSFWHSLFSCLSPITSQLRNRGKSADRHHHAGRKTSTISSSFFSSFSPSTLASFISSRSWPKRFQSNPKLSYLIPQFISRTVFLWHLIIVQYKCFGHSFGPSVNIDIKITSLITCGHSIISLSNLCLPVCVILRR